MWIMQIDKAMKDQTDQNTEIAIRHAFTGGIANFHILGTYDFTMLMDTILANFEFTSYTR